MTFGRVNHLGAKPVTQAYSAWARPLWVAWNEYLAKSGRVNKHTSHDTLTRISVRWCLAEELACGDQRRRMGSGSALEAALRRCAIQMHVYFALRAWLPTTRYRRVTNEWHKDCGPVSSTKYCISNIFWRCTMTFGRSDSLYTFMQLLLLVLFNSLKSVFVNYIE